MQYRKLGKTGIDVSAICLGTMTWGVQNSEKEAHEQIDYALSQGVNFIDTAEMYPVPATEEKYGITENYIGSYLEKYKNRSKIILATKVAGNGTRWMHGGSDINRQSILNSLDSSLKRLKTDYIDLYQLHWPNRGSYHFGQLWNYKTKRNSKEDEIENFTEVLITLQSLIQAGKIRYIGLSNETAWGTMQYIQLSESKNLPRVASVQNEYSLLYRLHEGDMHEISVREQIGLLAWSPLAAGMLSGKYRNGARPQGSRWALQKKFNQRDTPEAHNAVDAYLKLAKTHSLDVTQMALAFVLSRPFTTAAIIGATTMEQLKTNIAAHSLVLSDSVLNAIQKIWQKYPVPF
ncbi:MAG: Protein tas [Turneriella sp.]|nr:Protein tas [Turneriella sp.]